jgi:deoxycytidine triphosphate deaminase
MIFAHMELIEVVRAGIISPVLPEDINGSSIDVRLGPILMKEVWPRLPGDNKLELHNISQFHNIVMRAGDKIGQMIFHAHDKVPAQMSYAKRGAYNHDSGPSAAKPETKR